MGFTDMAIKLGAYTQKSLDANNNGISEFNRVTNAQSGVVEFEDFDFDENGVVDYQRSYLYTEDGKKTIEEFYTNSPKNNEKIWQKEKSPFDKILNSLGIETEPTLSDIDMEAMRAQADELTAKYVAEFGEEEELKAESFAIIEAQIEAAKAAVSKSIEDLPFKIS